MVCGWLLTNTSLSPVLVVVLGVGAGLLAGAVNALIVVVLGVDSFIGTLATGAIFGAATLGISGGQILTGRIAGGFSKIASINVGGIDITVLYMLVLMVALGIFLEHTATGRYSYSVGFNADAARLVGLKVDRYRAMSLLTSAGIAGFAGVVEAAQIQAADPNNGPSYLIPAFSAAFLGATQFRAGRFNPWGAVVAVLLLGTGSVGLLLAGAPQWAPEVFEGVILIAAMSVTVRQKKHAARGE
jgi:ribose transport system permease protein